MSRIFRSHIVVLLAIGAIVPIQFVDPRPVVAASLGNGDDFGTASVAASEGPGYFSAIAVGAASIAVGAGAKAGSDCDTPDCGSGQIAIGGNLRDSAGVESSRTLARGNNAIAIGAGPTLADGLNAVAGAGSTAGGQFSSAFGTGANAAGNGSVAAGNTASAHGIISVAVGPDSSANDGAVAVGSQANAGGGNSIAMGQGTAETGSRSFGAGTGGDAAGNDSIAIGTKASTVNTANKTGGDSAVAVGNTALASAGHSTAVVSAANAKGVNSSAYGNGTAAGGSDSAAVGNAASASGASSLALGDKSTATKSNGMAFGTTARQSASDLPVVQRIEAIAEGEIVELVVHVWLSGKNPALAPIRAQITAPVAKALADQMGEAAAMASGKTIARKRGGRARVREILMQDWDPIGVSGTPSHEYDTYADKAHVMLTVERATVEEIAAYLLHIATEHMGLNHAEQAERSGRAANAIVSLRRTFEMHNTDGTSSI